MRYQSLLSVDYILVDGRTVLKALTSILQDLLWALQRHLDYHIVVLCDSLSDADRIDLIGEPFGQELFFHGEVGENVEEIRLLLNAAALFVVPQKLWDTAAKTYTESAASTPLLKMHSTYAEYYASGLTSTHKVKTTLLDCVFSLSKSVKQPVKN